MVKGTKNSIKEEIKDYDFWCDKSIQFYKNENIKELAKILTIYLNDLNEDVKGNGVISKYSFCLCSDFHYTGCPFLSSENFIEFLNLSGVEVFNNLEVFILKVKVVAYKFNNYLENYKTLKSSRGKIENHHNYIIVAFSLYLYIASNGLISLIEKIYKDRGVTKNTLFFRNLITESEERYKITLKILSISKYMNSEINNKKFHDDFIDLLSCFRNLQYTILFIIYKSCEILLKNKNPIRLEKFGDFSLETIVKCCLRTIIDERNYKFLKKRALKDGHLFSFN